MAHLVRIGNSQGVRIPKAILAQMGFKKDTDLTFEVTEKGLLLVPAHNSREGWEEAFRSAKKEKSKSLLMGDHLPNTFDSDEWEW